MAGWMAFVNRIAPWRARCAGVLLAAAMWSSACGDNRPQARTVLVGVPDRVNEHVSVASDGASLVALAWAASSEADGTDVFAAVSTDGGESFSPPVRVNTIARQADVNGEQPPRIAVVREADDRVAIVVVWTARGEGGTALLSARSIDGGRTFGPASPLPGVDAPGNRGWESLAVGPDGQVYALWLDHRDAARSGTGHAGHHQHGSSAPAMADGTARAQRSQLFVSSLDGSLPARGITRGVCYCCKTAVATGPDGTIHAAWRHVYDGNRRDIAFTQSRDGGRSFDPPVRVSEDNWQLDGCPENGPALAIDRAGLVHVVWPTLVSRAGGETLMLFHAASRDGRAFTARAELPTSGAANHPQLAATPAGTLIAAWDELQSGTRHVRAARGQPGADGRITFTRILDDDDATGGYPALAAAGRHAILAWPRRGDGASSIAVRRIE